MEKTLSQQSQLNYTWNITEAQFKYFVKAVAEQTELIEKIQTDAGLDPAALHV